MLFDYVLIYYVFFGIAAGIFVGLLPGIGNTFILILLFPLLIHTDPIYIIVFAISMLSISQFTGSITSIILAAPGESSSMPALYEGHRMYQNQRGSFALSGCAIGSTVGALLALFFTMTIIEGLDSYAVFYSTKTQVYILLAVLLFLLFNQSNHWIVNLLLIIAGYLLGLIGVNSLDWTKKITFGFDQLVTDIPIFPVLFWLFVFPQILSSWEKYKPLANKNYKLENHDMIEHIKMYLVNIWSSIRGTVFGYFMGLVPYLTTIAASNVSYSIESWIQKRKKTYNINGDYPSLIASETANNAASLSSFLPLLVIGVPINASEAIVLNLATMNGYVFSIDNFLNIFALLSMCLIFVNIVGLLVSWPITQHLHAFFYKINFHYVYSFVILFSVAVILYIGTQNSQLFYYSIISLILAPIGYFLKKVNTIPLVFVFLLQNSIEENFTRFIFYL